MIGSPGYEFEGRVPESSAFLFLIPGGKLFPRIRTIKPEFFRHEDLFDLEQETKLPIRLAFSGLWCCCDREGRFIWRPRALKTVILPFDKIDFSRVLDALTTRGFVVKYASNGEYFGYIPRWKKHQVINNRESASELPNPSISQQVDACGTRESRDDDASRKEGKGKEGKGIFKDIAQPPTLSESRFEIFWNSYPRKVGKPAANKAWKAILGIESHSGEVLAGLSRWIPTWSDPQFIPHPATFLNQRRWEDEPTKGGKFNGRSNTAKDHIERAIRNAEILGLVDPGKSS